MKDAGFSTAITFDVLEDFKERLHTRQFKTDNELSIYMQQINLVYEKETDYLRHVRKKVKTAAWNSKRRTQ